MLLTTASALLLSAALTAQPAGVGRPLSPQEVAELESKRLTNIRQVTYGFFRAGEGYFSPDGKRIIFQATANPEEGVLSDWRIGRNDYQIYTSELSPGAKPKMVSTGKGTCTCAFFAPDGKSIIFASTHLDPEPPATAGPRGGRYSWSFPDGMDIFRADLDGGNLKRLTDSKGYNAEGSLSPDGNLIVYTSFQDGDGEIYIMDADGKNPRRITNAKGYDGGPFFSPDGKRIIYRSDRKGNDQLQIFVNNIEGTDERALTDNDAVNWAPYWHPDGKHIVYATSRHGHSNFELYLMNVDTGAEERLTFHSGFDALPVFSPDGKQLMWTSNGRNLDLNSQLFIADFKLDSAP